MSLDVKTLRTGQLKLSAGVSFLPGARVLYAAPKSGIFTATSNRSALITAIRFLNTNGSGMASVTINLYFVRYDSGKMIHERPRIRILPANMALASGQWVLEDTRFTLEEGDVLLGDASQGDVIDYIISGTERDVL